MYCYICALFVNQRACRLAINCHVRALFINWHWIATNWSRSCMGRRSNKLPSTTWKALNWRVLRVKQREVRSSPLNEEVEGKSLLCACLYDAMSERSLSIKGSPPRECTSRDLGQMAPSLKRLSLNALNQHFEASHTHKSMRHEN